MVCCIFAAAANDGNDANATVANVAVANEHIYLLLLIYMHVCMYAYICKHLFVYVLCMLRHHHHHHRAITVSSS